MTGSVQKTLELRNGYRMFFPAIIVMLGFIALISRAQARLQEATAQAEKDTLQPISTMLGLPASAPKEQVYSRIALCITENEQTHLFPLFSLMTKEQRGMKPRIAPLRKIAPAVD